MALYEATVVETRHEVVQYTVEADSVEEAQDKLYSGETESEEGHYCRAVVDREIASDIKHVTLSSDDESGGIDQETQTTTADTRSLFAATHSHRHGESVYLFRAATFTEDDFTDYLGDDYEPDRADEFLSIEKVEIIEFP